MWPSAVMSVMDEHWEHLKETQFDATGSFNPKWVGWAWGNHQTINAECLEQPDGHVKAARPGLNPNNLSWHRFPPTLYPGSTARHPRDLPPGLCNLRHHQKWGKFPYLYVRSKVYENISNFGSGCASPAFLVLLFINCWSSGVTHTEGL